METVENVLEAIPAKLAEAVSPDIDIEKVREAASAHYDDLTEEQKKAAWSFFQTMDKDKSGNVSVDEFTAFLNLAGFQNVNPDKLFAELDKDNNGTLSFKELVTFFYVLSRDEYKHLLTWPSSEVPGPKAKSGRGMVGGAKDQWRRWSTTDLKGLYNKFKGVYRLGEWVNENVCTIV
ncbi:hypothetical protein BT93_L5895 [Corymbia citriodora subsp. variegata]|uniref:EF-hand domain-containing protein n=1 Tax=Corymbia citriodora subsp. variegata TaxID=360336 RepID=A0A8T0CSA8_CORYI|nr:hypothetical protein BT93_L5895 [Corymbia citriodora subsp. variegata]